MGSSLLCHAGFRVGGTPGPFLAPGPSLLFLKRTGKKGCGNTAGARRDSGFFSKELASWEGCRREKQGMGVPKFQRDYTRH